MKQQDHHAQLSVENDDQSSQRHVVHR